MIILEVTVNLAFFVFWPIRF